MQAIFDLLSTLVLAIQSFVEFIVNFVGDMVHMIGVLVELLPALPAFFTWLPGTVNLSISLMLAIAILYRVLGWGD